MTAATANAGVSRWLQAWPDALAFAGGLAVAWFARWETTDLVWSLWLSSLVVGYATILWLATATLREFIGNACWDPSPGAMGAKIATGAVIAAGAGFTVIFFTVHFGMFHFVHSVFLNQFFPVDPKGGRHFPEAGMYVEVLRRYWWFLPLAFLAERRGFVAQAPGTGLDTAVTAEAIARRKAPGDFAPGTMTAPYRNVVRMHLLIFFFAGASVAKLDGFLVYAVVYAVYFFPWRLLKPNASLPTTA